MGNVMVSKQSMRGAKVFRVQGSPYYLIKKDGKTFSGKAGAYYRLSDGDWRNDGAVTQETYMRPGHNDQVVVSQAGKSKLQCTGRQEGRSRRLIQLPTKTATAVISSAKRFVSLPVYDVPKAVYRMPNGKSVLLTRTFYTGDPRLFIGTVGKMRELAIKSVIRMRDGGSLIVKTQIGTFFISAGFNWTKKSTYTTPAGIKTEIRKIKLSAKALATAARGLGVKLRTKTPDSRRVKLFCD